jgi:hypothetical protein
MNDGLARFNAHFDSDCERCGGEIEQGDPIAFDKLNDAYVCGDCRDELAEEREVRLWESPTQPG